MEFRQLQQVSFFHKNAQFGLFSFLAVASWYVISDFVGTNPTQHGTRIDPMMYKHTDNAESDANAGSESNAGDDKDVNGVEVPNDSISGNEDRRGEGKNGSKINQKREASWKEKELDARNRLAEAKRSGATKKEKAQIEKEIKHAVTKQKGSENHAQSTTRR